jgi:hypothetical protein
MYSVRNVLILILSILSLAYIQAQDTYIKRFKIYDDRFPIANSVVIDDKNIFIESRGDCNGDACGHVSNLDLFGNVLYDIPFEGLYGGNSNNLILDEEHLYYTTYSYPIQRYNFVKMVKSTGEIMLKKHFALDSISLDRMNVESFMRTDTGFLIAGEFVNKNGIASGIMQWIDNDYNPVRTTTYNLPNNFNVNAIQDLQPDGYGNLVFATVLKTAGGSRDTLVIRKIDTIGNAIKNVKIPSNTSIAPRPQFAVTNKGNYVFSHESSELVNIYQLVCSDTSGTILWHHDYPTKIPNVPTNIFHTYEIRQITPTNDDGVIITATIKSNEFGHNHRDAYIGKFDHKGTLEWERKINFLDDRDLLYDQCYLYDIKERPDGKGYIAVGTYTPSDTFTISILLVSLDGDGCIEGLECDDGRIIVATDNHVDQTNYNDNFLIYPNPTSGLFNFEINDTKSKDMSIILRDINGRFLTNLPYYAGLIDISIYPPGLYILEFNNSDKRSYKKVIKI